MVIALDEFGQREPHLPRVKPSAIIVLPEQRGRFDLEN